MSLSSDFEPKERSKSCPWQRVLLIYSGLGGVVGGLWVLIISASFTDTGSVKTLVALPFAMAIGVYYGFVPAVITALFLIWRRWERDGWLKMFWLFMVGFCSTFVVFYVSEDWNSSLMSLLFMLASIGGLSAVVLSWALPKREV